jgi:bifunctional non-homologous end joining protein LigD
MATSISFACGVIAKRGSAPYTGGRSNDWLKLKCVLDQELVIGGFTDPKGSRTGLGAILVGYFEDGDLAYAGKVGTGFNQELLGELRRKLDRLERATPPFTRGIELLPAKDVHWVRPALVAQVGFAEWTRDGRLRHPRFQGLRTDKPPREVVRERAGAPR